jgi:serine/threonine protein phosphatase PrpC
MNTTEYSFNNNYLKKNVNNKTTLSTINIGNLKNFTFFSTIDNIKSYSKQPINKRQKKLTRFDSDNIGQNKFYFTNLLNNHITIINNIYQNKSSKDFSNSDNKSDDRNNQYTKKFEIENISSPKELNIHNVGKKRTNTVKKIIKRNSQFVDNKQINKINNVFFSENNKINNNINSTEFHDVEKLDNFNRPITEENTSKSLNLIEKENDTIIKTKLKELLIKKSEQINHFKKFGIFKGFIALSSKNGKNINEDKIRISINTPINSNKETINFFAIFDGHNGDKSATFLKENFHINLIKHEEIIKEPKKAILDTFNLMEKKLLEINSQQLNKSGSCVIILFNKKKELYIANLGNSRAIISIENSKEINQISNDHILTIEKEKDRIKQFGGKIFPKNNGTKFFIIPGNLEVTRSLGDIESKLKKFSGIPFMISHLPDLYKINNIEKIDFIVLTSSGALEKLNNADFAKIIYSTLKNGVENDFSFDKTICNINENLMNCIIDRGCKGNVSFIFIYTDKLYKLFKDKKILLINDILIRLKFSLDCMSDINNNDIMINSKIENNKFAEQIFDGCFPDKINNENGLIINYTYNSKNSGFNKNNNNDNKKKKNSAFFWINLICGCN